MRGVEIRTDCGNAYAAEGRSKMLYIGTMIDYWKEVEFEIHPALDLAATFRQQGMNIT